MSVLWRLIMGLTWKQEDPTVCCLKLGEAGNWLFVSDSENPWSREARLCILVQGRDKMSWLSSNRQKRRTDLSLPLPLPCTGFLEIGWFHLCWKRPPTSLSIGFQVQSHEQTLSEMPSEIMLHLGAPTAQSSWPMKWVVMASPRFQLRCLSLG